MATTIKIRNIGPIKEADLDLNRVNVFMGQQSSGKSTIAKIISYCTWVEKDVATLQSLEEYQKDKEQFKSHLEKYHKLKGYFNHPDRYISYKSDVIKLEYSAESFFIEWQDRYAYKRSKISYIPSERNLITLPEVRRVEFGDSNIRSFLFDWFDARKKYSDIEAMSILGLDAAYYYNETADEDRIINKQNGKDSEISLSNASSGLQSVTPLLTMVNYLTDGFYEEDETISAESINKRRRLIAELIRNKYFKENHSEENWRNESSEAKSSKNVRIENMFDEFINVVENLNSSQNSQFIIEEPEQNLFPETQRDLLYHLLEKCTKSKREHRLTITTHSPYILYALNNCMMGGLVGDKMSEKDKEKLKCKTAFVLPKDVSIYEIHDGILKPIQQDDGLISENYFDKNMKALMDDFYVMLNYYGV